MTARRQLSVLPKAYIKYCQSDTQHRRWSSSLIGCSPASWWQWFLRGKCQWKTGNWGRNTWGCGAGVQADGKDDEQHPCDGEQVYGKEEDKEWLLVLGPGGESQEDELGDTAGLVDSLHGPAFANKCRNILDFSVQHVSISSPLSGFLSTVHDFVFFSIVHKNKLNNKKFNHYMQGHQRVDILLENSPPRWMWVTVFL